MSQPSARPSAVIVLAAGQGTRMKSTTPKIMHAIGGRSLVGHALAAAWSETAGGAALALGAGTPLAAAGLIGSMSTAIRKVHAANGVWNVGGGYEYNLVLIAAAAALTADGPGRLSLDALVGRSRWGAGFSAFSPGFSESCRALNSTRGLRSICGFFSGRGCPPPRTATARSWRSAKRTVATTSCGSAQRTTSAGRRSICPFHTRRASS